jgi:hypothetical protein
MDIDKALVPFGPITNRGHLLGCFKTPPLGFHQG